MPSKALAYSPLALRIARRVRTLRGSRTLSVCSRRWDTDIAALWRVEQGRGISLALLFRIATVERVSLDWLTGRQLRTIEPGKPQ